MKLHGENGFHNSMSIELELLTLRANVAQYPQWVLPALLLLISGRVQGLKASPQDAVNLTPKHWMHFIPDAVLLVSFHFWKKHPSSFLFVSKAWDAMLVFPQMETPNGTTIYSTFKRRSANFGGFRGLIPRAQHSQEK